MVIVLTKVFKGKILCVEQESCNATDCFTMLCFVIKVTPINNSDGKCYIKSQKALELVYHDINCSFNISYY